MSTTRSLRIGRFPIAEMTGTRPSCAMSYIRVLQARTAAPSIRIPHEPPIIIRPSGVPPGLAGEGGGPAHPQPAGAADHHPAALAVRERAVVTVLDDVEAV